ncbi:tyrosine-type recombinase/integrase [Butyrivibrio sp. VCD2006]|uniref:tyrosine-type recombinase/integrase n=1 Tax=Butyrivibrio sp. VCD2006 TaxID=1280664 RepID=UPI00040C83D4|nr:tyrosine-type recombinase/integrase [Butyrivibrio sp. VCD2006]
MVHRNSLTVEIPEIEYYFRMGFLSLTDIMNLEKEELMNKLLKKVHKYKITPPRNKNERWSTYIPDPKSPHGRKLVRKQTETQLIKFLLDFYQIGEGQSQMTVSELFPKWIEYKRQFINVSNLKQSISPSTIRRYEREFDKYFADTELADMVISEITTPQLQSILSTIIKENHLSEKNASNLIGYIRGIFAYAYDNEYIEKDPAKRMDRKLLLSGCKFTPPKSDHERVITEDEIIALSFAIREHETQYPHYMPDYAIELALLTGMRVGEIVCIKWSDIDENHHAIHIVRSEHRLDYSDRPSEIVIGRTKNGKTRTFPLTSQISELLVRIKALNHFSSEGYIFTREDGHRYTGHDVGCAVCRRAKEAGIDKTSIHEIRRTVSSHLNTKLKNETVGEMLGHSAQVNAYYYDYSIASNSQKMDAAESLYSNVFNSKKK